jgi:hypothetical protein
MLRILLGASAGSFPASNARIGRGPSAPAVRSAQRVRVRPNGTTAEIENRVGHVWTLRDGKVVSLDLFPKRDLALEAAGLRE